MTTGWRGQYFRYKDFFLNIVALYKQRKDLRAFLELILSLSTVIIFVVFALKPTAITIVSLNNQIKNKRATLVTLKQKISDLKSASSVFDQNQALIPDVEDAVFSKPEPDTISKQILGLALKDQVSILGASVGQVVIIGKNVVSKSSTEFKPLPENAFAMPLSISAKGTYSELLTFIRDVENSRIPIKVDSLMINASQTQDGNTIVGIITARVPYIGQ